MFRQLATILSTLIQRSEETGGAFIFDPVPQLDETRTDESGIVRSLNAAFLLALAGPYHPAAKRANTLLDKMAASPKWATVAGFYKKGIEAIRQELVTVCEREPDFGGRLRRLAEWIATQDILLDTKATQEGIWSVFFPEGTGIKHNEEQQVEVLRQRRHVKITQLNDSPISHPIRQIIFTSNVLLTLPAASTAMPSGLLSWAATAGPPSPPNVPTPVPAIVEMTCVAASTNRTRSFARSAM